MRRSWGIPVGLTALLLEAKNEDFHSMMRYAPIDTRSRQNATSHHPGTVNTDPRTILKRPCGRIVGALEGIGHRVVTAAGDIHSNATAVAVARQLSGARPDLTIVNVPVWAFPHFTVLAAQETSGAVLLVSNVDPQYPGMVGMLAAGGGLDQMGRLHERAWGEVEGQAVLRQLDALARAGAAASSQLRRRGRGARWPGSGQ